MSLLLPNPCVDLEVAHHPLDSHQPSRNDKTDWKSASEDFSWKLAIPIGKLSTGEKSPFLFGFPESLSSSFPLAHKLDSGPRSSLSPGRTSRRIPGEEGIGPRYLNNSAASHTKKSAIDLFFYRVKWTIALVFLPLELAAVLSVLLSATLGSEPGRVCRRRRHPPLLLPLYIP